METTNKERNIGATFDDAVAMVTISGTTMHNGTHQILHETIICANCGKVLSGELEMDRHCCWQLKQQEPKGWICPNCGAGLSPNTSKCPCTEPAFRVS